MSEFTNHKEIKANRLTDLFYLILKGENLAAIVAENQQLIKSTGPADVVLMVDLLVQAKIPMGDLKRGINKTLNLLHKTLSEYPCTAPEKVSFLGCLIENNRKLDALLQQVKQLLRDFNKNQNEVLKAELSQRFSEIEKVDQYYLIKENILFPLIEKHVPAFRCLSVMWSFHDDIRRNLKGIIKELESAQTDLVRFNRLTGDVFFNIYAVKFREERILFPVISNYIPEEELNALFADSSSIGFPFFQPVQLQFSKKDSVGDQNKINLETGNLTVEQIKLLFNHLPVDITFVDENNKVCYFSSPQKRIFPRTKAVIGRNVHNCHPPESVHVVEEIVKSFRTGKKDVASFWINMKGMKLLIQYFPVRDENGIYRGVVEVSQEIGEIQNLTGEKRLLDWE
ncbi:MAG: DUF438 domain-containing protein [Draconibacterium sp.]